MSGIRLHLGCGQVRMDGYVNVDYVHTPAVDEIVDLSGVWPWDDNSVEHAYSSHVIEHLPMREDIRVDGLVVFLNELGRVLKPGAKAELRAPYGKSQRAFQDPTHRRFIVDTTFHYASRAWREENGLSHYPITCDLTIASLVLDGLRTDVLTRHPEAQVRILGAEWDAAADIVVVLEKPAATPDTM